MTDKELASVACKLIAGAGEAQNFFYQSLEAAKKGDYENSESLMKQGDEAMLETHKAQAKLLWSEANESPTDITLLMVHAQDHVMQAILFERVVKELIEMYSRMGDKK